MDGEIELVDDGDGLAVIGSSTAVEEFLQVHGLWGQSKSLDLRKLRSVVGVAADVTEAGAEISANSARWLKLTPESAALRKEYGLMKGKEDGVTFAMIGKPGSVKSWLQVEGGPAALLTNPAVLSGAAGLMAQIATQDAMAEITDYLVRIDAKVDDVLRNQRDDVLARMIGASLVIEEAMTVRGSADTVNEVTWGKVQGTSETIGYTQAYALLKIKQLAEEFEGESKVRDLAKTAEQVEAEVQEWLAVLARCFQLQSALDVLELDRVLAVAPDELDDHRRGLRTARDNRLKAISEHTELLLDHLGGAVDTANLRILWTRAKSLSVVDAGNHVAGILDDFHQALGIEADMRSWEPRQLGRAASVGAQAIQKTKDSTPYIAAGTLAVGAVVVRRVNSGGGPTA